MKRGAWSGLDELFALFSAAVHIAFGLLVFGLFIKLWIESGFWVAFVVAGLLYGFIFPVLGLLFPIHFVGKK